jgi:hypothetical protein
MSNPSNSLWVSHIDDSWLLGTLEFYGLFMATLMLVYSSVLVIGYVS